MEGGGGLKHLQNSTEGPQQKRTWKREKKARNFWPSTFRGPTLRFHLSGPTFRAPLYWAPPSGHFFFSGVGPHLERPPPFGTHSNAALTSKGGGSKGMGMGPKGAQNFEEISFLFLSPGVFSGILVEDGSAGALKCARWSSRVVM